MRRRLKLHAHPKTHRDTVRVRFAEYGESSLNICVRIYALTREWNESFALREDIYLRIKDIVDKLKSLPDGEDQKAKA